MLDSRDLVSCSAVILSNLGFDHDLRVELVGHDEVGSLVETGDLLCPLRLSERDSRLDEHGLDCRLHHVADQLGDGVTVGGERPAEQALVQQHGVRYAELS